MEAYITGSRAYGTPRDNSDIDLVIACRTDDISTLWEFTEANDGRCAYGLLNLVVFNLDKPDEVKRYESWKAAHDRLVARSPVTKDDAIKEFREAGAESHYLGTSECPPEFDFIEQSNGQQKDL